MSWRLISANTSKYLEVLILLCRMNFVYFNEGNALTGAKIDVPVEEQSLTPCIKN